MRILLALALFVSFSVHAQRVKENVRQQRLITSEKQAEKKEPIKKSPGKTKKSRANKLR